MLKQLFGRFAFDFDLLLEGSRRQQDIDQTLRDVVEFVR